MLEVNIKGFVKIGAKSTELSCDRQMNGHNRFFNEDRKHREQLFCFVIITRGQLPSKNQPSKQYKSI